MYIPAHTYKYAHTYTYLKSRRYAPRKQIAVTSVKLDAICGSTPKEMEKKAQRSNEVSEKEGKSQEKKMDCSPSFPPSHAPPNCSQSRQQCTHVC